MTTNYPVTAQPSDCPPTFPAELQEDFLSIFGPCHATENSALPSDDHLAAFRKRHQEPLQTVRMPRRLPDHAQGHLANGGPDYMAETNGTHEPYGIVDGDNADSPPDSAVREANALYGAAAAPRRPPSPQPADRPSQRKGPANRQQAPETSLSGLLVYVGLAAIAKAVGAGPLTIKRWIREEAFPARRCSDGIYRATAQSMRDWFSPPFPGMTDSLTSRQWSEARNIGPEGDAGTGRNAGDCHAPEVRQNSAAPKGKSKRNTATPLLAQKDGRDSRTDGQKKTAPPLAGWYDAGSPVARKRHSAEGNRPDNGSVRSH